MTKGRLHWVNMATSTYVFVAWAGGIALLTQPRVVFNVLGVLLTAHALIYSAYLIHECVHHAACATSRGNDRLGVLMSWINGASMASYARLKKKHLRHHSDRLDVVTFDYRAALKKMPAWARRLVLTLEWAYIPAVQVMIRAMILVQPLSAGPSADRRRVLVVLAIRLVCFAALAWISLRALLLYAVAYWIFLSVLR